MFSFNEPTSGWPSSLSPFRGSLWVPSAPSSFWSPSLLVPRLSLGPQCTSLVLVSFPAVSAALCPSPMHVSCSTANRGTPVPVSVETFGVTVRFSLFISWLLRWSFRPSSTCAGGHAQRGWVWTGRTGRLHSGPPIKYSLVVRSTWLGVDGPYWSFAFRSLVTRVASRSPRLFSVICPLPV